MERSGRAPTLQESEAWAQARMRGGGRKLAVVIHSMWRDGTEFRFKQADEHVVGVVKGCPKVQHVAT